MGDEIDKENTVLIKVNLIQVQLLVLNWNHGGATHPKTFLFSVEGRITHYHYWAIWMNLRKSLHS